MGETQPEGRQVPRSLFIVGCARTGSTLLRHVLNRADGVVILPETHFMRRATRLRLAQRLTASTMGRGELRAIVEDLYALDGHSRTGYWAWLRRTVPRGEFAERLAATDASLQALFTLLMDLYVERTGTERPLRVLGEKTPSHLLFVPTLAEWFPAGAVIHTFRDPRAIYASELRRRREGRWGPKRWLAWLPDRIVDSVLGPLEAVRTALAWRRADRLDLIYRRNLGARYRLVRFEDLVADPTRELGAICEHIGVPFDPALLDIDVVGSSFEPGRHAASGFDPVTLERWRQHVGPVARAWFRIALGRRMRVRGYRV